MFPSCFLTKAKLDTDLRSLYIKSIRLLATKHKAHANPYNQEISGEIGTENRLQTYPSGSQLTKKLEGLRRGQQETWWGGQVHRVEPLPLHLIPCEENMWKAYAYLDSK